MLGWEIDQGVLEMKEEHVCRLLLLKLSIFLTVFVLDFVFS